VLVEDARRHEGVKPNLSVPNREELLHHLADKRTDLAVMVRPPAGADTIHEPFAPHPYVIVAAADHPLVRVRNIPMSRVIREPFVVREQGSDTWQSMAEGLGTLLRKLNIALQIKSTETIKQAVIAGMGIGFLSAHTVSRELRSGSLAALDVQGFPLMLNWYIVQRRQKRLPPVAQAFKQFLLRDGARLIAEVVPVPARTFEPRPTVALRCAALPHSQPVYRGALGKTPARHRSVDPGNARDELWLRSAPEQLLDAVGDTPVERRDGAGKGGDDAAVAVDQILVEVPLRRLARGLRQLDEEGVSVGPTGAFRKHQNQP
jgi:hypothetical protein